MVDKTTIILSVVGAIVVGVIIYWSLPLNPFIKPSEDVRIGVSVATGILAGVYGMFEIGSGSTNAFDNEQCSHEEGAPILKTPQCDGKEDPITYETISKGKGYCLNGHCYNGDTLLKLPNREVDPTKQPYRMDPMSNKKVTNDQFAPVFDDRLRGEWQARYLRKVYDVQHFLLEEVKDEMTRLAGPIENLEREEEIMHEQYRRIVNMLWQLEKEARRAMQQLPPALTIKNTLFNRKKLPELLKLESALFFVEGFLLGEYIVGLRSSLLDRMLLLANQSDGEIMQNMLEKRHNFV